jgi:hypothetical protein
MTPSPETPVARSRYSSKLRAYMRSYDVLCHVAVPQSQEVEGSYHAASTVTEEEDFVVSATVRVRSTSGSTRREVMLHLRTRSVTGNSTR